MKKYLLVMYFMIFGFFAHGSNLVLRDSIGIEKIGNQSFIVHLVSEKETLFGISRRYQTSVNEIIQKNEELKQGLKIGQRILIPYITKTAIPTGAKVHKVTAGETLFSISKVYNITVGEIMSWNKLQGNDLSVGQALIIEGAALANSPSEKPEVGAQKNARTANPNREKSSAEPKKAAEKPIAKENNKVAEVRNTSSSVPAAPSNNAETLVPGDWITHTVGAGETLFGVATKYNAKMGDLINWNALSSNNLAVGQKLKVGREAAAPSTVPVIKATVPVIINNERVNGTLSSPEPAEAESNTAYKNMKQTGLAEVIEGTGNHKKYLVLHRDAPVGTIMRVRNEENDITIFARVVGKLPETGDNSRLVIKLSKAAFDQLRAINSRFPVEISF
ncbi:LysM peptidoglycan-binding domain-containing protein [Rhodonellum sp.]|uniref:LysM peptidoglycan-binding domain-containing protein n=1 Tax=Rhodonellum sp. TaxID=2231180 RepID=UPI0027290202|nr:LysM peptidoglycan-binding domain-containing protein [Rhodonellum sp.]MDO9553200.1 LysM peptidoglycan-binding domain-containing protein [Rhodonellum sp.]